MAIGDNSPLGIKLTIKPFTKNDFSLAIKNLEKVADTTPIKLKIEVDAKYIEKQVNDVFRVLKLDGVGGDATKKVSSSITAQLSAYEKAFSKLEQLQNRLSANKNNPAISNLSSSDIWKNYSQSVSALNGMTPETEGWAEAVKNLAVNYGKVNQEISKTLRNATGDNRLISSATELNNLYARIGETLKNNKRLENSDIGKSMRELQLGIQAGTNNIKSAQNEFSKLNAKAVELGLTAETVGGKLKKLFTEHISTAVAMAGIHALQLSLRAVYQNVVDIDTAITELKKVTNETDTVYSKFLTNAASSAKQFGSTISNYTESVADWARLGYNLADSEELGKVSVMFSNVGDGINSASEAVSYLISTLQGFGLVADDAQHVLDAINKVGNEFPVGAAGVGEILQRSSAALAAANNTLEETIGLGTAMNSVLQDEEKTGAVLKTISMYLRSTKSELEDAGESTDGMAESTSKLREQLYALSHGKVDIQLDEDTYKSTYQIIKEMSGAWKDMTDMEQAAALELMGGKRNANAVSALIQNFSVAEQAMQAATDSAGSAMAENEKYLDSINGKAAQFSATFQALSTTLLDSELVKFIIDIGTAFTGAIDSATKFAGVLPTIATAISGVLTATGNKAGKVNMPFYADYDFIAA